jgi:hypothetical protein
LFTFISLPSQLIAYINSHLSRPAAATTTTTLILKDVRTLYAIRSIHDVDFRTFLCYNMKCDKIAGLGDILCVCLFNAFSNLFAPHVA